MAQLNLFYLVFTVSVSANPFIFINCISQSSTSIFAIQFDTNLFSISIFFLPDDFSSVSLVFKSPAKEGSKLPSN